MKKIFAVLFLVFLSMSAFGQEDVLVSDNGHLFFQNQDYTVGVALVDDLKETLAVWNVPDVTPNIKTTTGVEANGQISVFIIYATEKDSVNLTYNLRMITPDGVFSERLSYDGLVISNNVIEKQMLYAAEHLPTVVFTDADKPGIYNLIVVVYDGEDLIKIFALEFTLS